MFNFLNYFDYWQQFTALAVLDVILVACVVPWVIMTRKEPAAAVAWCLVVVLMPIVGAGLFWVFGYSRIVRPLRRMRLHHQRFRTAHQPRRPAAARISGEPVDSDKTADPTWQKLGSLALKLNAFPVSHGNRVTHYHDTQQAFDAKLAAVASAKEHVHVAYFIWRPDATGAALRDALVERAKAGVEVRVLMDAVGCLYTPTRFFQPLIDAGGKVGMFLPLLPFRSRFRINLRNHRKLLIVDGREGFTGGMNIGNEYLGKVPRYGYWRDAVIRVAGPGTAAMQRVFIEDWDFSTGEALNDERYFPDTPAAGEHSVQVVDSGPDQERNSARQLYFGAILAARERLWIATPYFVPDYALLEALRLAQNRGVDVRLLGLWHFDHLVPYFASRYYWGALIDSGLKIYQYRKGMMHSKFILVDGRWGIVGSANLDNRSLQLNFELGCALHSADSVAELEEAFLRDIEDAVPLKPAEFNHRPWWMQLAENTARLFSPVL